MTSGASYVSRLVGQGVRASLPTLLAWQDQRGHVPDHRALKFGKDTDPFGTWPYLQGSWYRVPTGAGTDRCEARAARTQQGPGGCGPRRAGVCQQGQRRTLARQMKRWRASLNPSRSPGTVGEKARCTERCAGCSCARGSAAGCAYRRPGWPTLAAGAWPKPATSWLGNCA
jgi:hypothetical protein